MADSYSITQNDERKILASLRGGHDAKDAFIILLHTGMRSRELQNLRWEDVYLSALSIVIKDGNSGVRRVVPIERELADMLARRMEQAQGQSFVFGANPKAAISNTVKVWRKISKVLGLPSFSCCHLRRWFGKRLANNKS